jgi:hypothetical protein
VQRLDKKYLIAPLVHSRSSSALSKFQKCCFRDIVCNSTRIFPPFRLLEGRAMLVFPTSNCMAPEISPRIARPRAEGADMPGIRNARKLARLLLLAIGIFAGFSAFQDPSAWAINRYTSTSMTCDAIQNTLKREGAAIFRYSSASGLLLYDRFVRDAGQCTLGTSITRRSSIPSRGGTCTVLFCQTLWGHNNR